MTRRRACLVDNSAVERVTALVRLNSTCNVLLWGFVLIIHFGD